MKAALKTTKAVMSFVLTTVLTVTFLAAAGSVFAKDVAAEHNHDHVAVAKAMTAVKASVTKSDGLRAGETRQTMNPSDFTGDTAKSYRIAKEIPAVLDSLYCYCHCKKHSGHKSLLSCYVDKHAAHCDICQDEAFMAYDLYKKGKSIKEIRAAVDKEFSNLKR